MNKDNNDGDVDARLVIEGLAGTGDDGSTDDGSASDETSGSTAEADDGPTLDEAIEQQAREDEQPQSNTFTLRKVLGGDILNTSTIRRQIKVVLLATFFVILYISNRYSCQQDLIEIDKLDKELQDAKYRALSSSSQLTEESRESHVLDQLASNKDSVLHIATQAPYLVNVPDDNE